MEYKVERLLVNFETLEEFSKFREYGIQELSMLEDLESNIIENNSQSPFYGIYFGDSLVARMSLYQKNPNLDGHVDQTSDYLLLWKLEVLPGYQRKGFGKALVDFAKRFNMPIYTIPKVHSYDFWKKIGFEFISNEGQRDGAKNQLVWRSANPVETESCRA
jgi:GNAT superfamily N-acetyltransferase